MQGVLYAGLMLTPDGPKVLEFNARFGDPETQVVLPLIDVDLADLLVAITDGKLAEFPPLTVLDRAAVGVVLASGGYPAPYRSGLPIAGLDAVPNDILVFHAGTKRDDAGRVVTAGGRVLTVVGLGRDLAAARERAYQGAALISFDDAHQRGDIAAREVPILR
jgi:phosphoribosylamine--glycine ligase